jgi:hypothetical protein
MVDVGSARATVRLQAVRTALAPRDAERGLSVAHRGQRFVSGMGRIVQMF